MHERGSKLVVSRLSVNYSVQKEEKEAEEEGKKRQRK